jgi:hypothetical protein
VISKIPKTGNTYSEDNSTDVILEARGADSLLVSLGGTSFIRQNETSTDPNSGSAEHQSSGNGVTVEETTGRDDLHGLAGQRALLALDQLGNGGDQNSGGHITSVTTALTTLGADDINANIQSLLDVLGVSDHVHAEDAGTVELLDNGLGGNTDGGDEKASLLLDNDIDELTELALGVIVAVCENKTRLARCAQRKSTGAIGKSYLVLRALPPTWGRRRSTPKGAFLSFR